MDNGLTRDRFGKRTDKTGVRDLAFNYWHRKYLSNKCYTTDIDFYEYRIEKNGRFIPKAFLEVKQAHVLLNVSFGFGNHKASLPLTNMMKQSLKHFLGNIQILS